MAPVIANSLWGDVPTWIGVCGGLIAFAIGLEQYRRSQLWQRSEFVSKQMADFFKDERVRTAFLLLDYSQIELTSRGERVRHGQPGSRFDDALCTRALRLHYSFADGQEQFTANEMLARESFDGLLTWLENFDHFLRTGLVEAADLRPYLGYWLRVMAEPTTGWKPPDFYQAMSRFITGYGYRGVKHLLLVVEGIELQFVEEPQPSPAEQYQENAIAPGNAPC